MKSDNVYRSLSNMAEEYDRLVSPLTKQLKIYDRWRELGSPLFRVANMNEEVLRGVKTIDTNLAHRLSLMVEPYKPILDNMSSIEKMMKTQFAELVHPKFYFPEISSRLNTFEMSTTKSLETTQISLPSTGFSTAMERFSNSIKPWQTNLTLVSAFENSLGTMDNSHFNRLVEMEKSVAGIPSVAAQYKHMTSVSAQIASLQQVGLTDAWKRAVVPPALLQGLNEFAVKQYEHIKKATDNQSIAWRFDLINVASKYVDAQVAWGFELATDSEECFPEAETATPDLSEFPQLLGPAKRDKRNIEEAFDDSSFREVTEIGKIIIQKAKAVNDFCKAQQRELLFPEAYLVNWALVLGSTICRDEEMLDEVMNTLGDMFIREPIVKLTGHHRCFTEIEANKGIKETKKGIITKLQKRMYNQILSIEDDLIEHFERATSSIFEEDKVSSNVLKALLTVQKDKLYENVKENNINDGIRNQLSWIYEVKDQTRQGVSESGKEAGEVDIVLCDNGNPIVIMEGLKLNSFMPEYIDKHISKALVNYDPMGCPLVYILIYVTAKGFSTFWDKVMDHMKDHNYPYETVEGMHELSTAYTDTRHAKAVLKRNGRRIGLHLYAVAMQ